jgi:hypothetical protein
MAPHFRGAVTAALPSRLHCAKVASEACRLAAVLHCGKETHALDTNRYFVSAALTPRLHCGIKQGEVGNVTVGGHPAFTPRLHCGGENNIRGALAGTVSAAFMLRLHCNEAWVQTGQCSTVMSPWRSAAAPLRQGQSSVGATRLGVVSGALRRGSIAAF